MAPTTSHHVSFFAPDGSFSLTATKAPFAYSTNTFVIQSGIELYVASPPHGIQGTNDSPPGQP